MAESVLKVFFNQKNCFWVFHKVLQQFSHWAPRTYKLDFTIFGLLFFFSLFFFSLFYFTGVYNETKKNVGCVDEKKFRISWWTKKQIKKYDFPLKLKSSEACLKLSFISKKKFINKNVFLKFRSLSLFHGVTFYSNFLKFHF